VVPLQIRGYPESERAGEFWRCTLIESQTRLRVARGLAKNETKASIEAFEQLKKRRGHPRCPPPVVSDGWIRRSDARGVGQGTRVSGKGKTSE
jgi:hypothetical protein